MPNSNKKTKVTIKNSSKTNNINIFSGNSKTTKIFIEGNNVIIGNSKNGHLIKLPDMQGHR